MKTGHNRPFLSERKHIEYDLESEEQREEITKGIGSKAGIGQGYTNEAIRQSMVNRAVDIASKHFGTFTREDRKQAKDEISDLVIESSAGIGEKEILRIMIAYDSGSSPADYTRVDMLRTGSTAYISNDDMGHMMYALGSDIDLSNQRKAEFFIRNHPSLNMKDLFGGKLSIAEYDSSSSEEEIGGVTKSRLASMLGCFVSSKVPRGFSVFYDQPANQTWFVDERIEGYLRKNFGDEADPEDPHTLMDNPNIICTDHFEGKAVVAVLEKNFSGSPAHQNKVGLNSYRDKPKNEGHFYEHAITQAMNKLE
ncbi:MAG: hypothetical protein R6U32_05405 [Candidatus Woesearchaeota archaeon]